MTPEDWVSQAEAARMRKTSRQAIARLIARGRLKTVTIAGRTLVNRADVLTFSQRTPGPRPGPQKSK